MAKDGNIKGWITIKGVHIPLMDGENAKEAYTRFFKNAKAKGAKAKEYKGEMKKEGSKRYFEKEDGTKIEYLGNKEYDKICDDFNNKLTDDERETILKYVDTPAMADSMFLNKLNDDDVDKIESPKDVSNGYEWGSKIAWNKNPNLLESQREHDDRADVEMKKAKEQNLSHYSLDEYARSKGFAPAEFYEGIAGFGMGVDAREANRQRAKTNAEFAKQYDEKNILKYIDYQDNTTKNIEYISRREALRRVDTPEFKLQDKKTREDLSQTANEQRKLDEIFDKKGVILDKDIIVYRRARENEATIKEGFTKYGYTSTTQRSNIAKKMPSGTTFGNSELEIIIPAGTKVLPLKAVIGDRMAKETDEYSINANKGVMKQNEILLPRETTYKYVSTYTGDYLGYGKGFETKYTVVADTSMQKHNYKYKSRKKVNGSWVYEY